MRLNKLNTLKPLVMALGFGLALGVGQATAGSVKWYGLTTFEDNDLDFHLTEDANGNLILDTDGTLDEDDVLVSVFQLDKTVNADQSASQAIGPDELTGIAAIQVASKTLTEDNMAPTPDEYTFVFAPYTGGIDAVLALGGVGPLPNMLGVPLTGAMAALWLDATPDLGAPPICVSLADCIAKAGDGDLWEVDGFYGDPDEFWVSEDAFDDIALVASLPAVTKVGVFNFGLSIGFNGTGRDLGEVDCPLCVGDQKIGVLGSGDLLGGANLTNDAIARSDIDFQKRSIPEPGSLAMLSAGLLGFGVRQRRRRKV